MVVDISILGEFPQSLLDQRSDDYSVHASSVFNHDEDGYLRIWFRQRLLDLGVWSWCPHPPEDAVIAHDAHHDFPHYIPDITALNLTVFRMEKNRGSYSYLNIHDPLGRVVALAGRPDYVISAPNTTKANFLYMAECVIVVQSQQSLELCEYQIQIYLLILMNVRGLMNIYGFLVRLDGNCRAYRCFRGVDGSGMDEEDSVFHVSHLAYVIWELLRNPPATHSIGYTPVN